ncbi:AAA family ATPase [Cellulosilyticum sp. ST5]|uniref:AAA family ATPase n=1 Tax=Cellulosilyticum sp. ST5 TaxID=3055805 RepID=UPI0039774E26
MQKIYFGAPGTGKSYTIDTNVIAGVSEDHVFRVTFYPDFSYNDFIGQLLPKVIPSTVPGGSSRITYDFQKGVFTQALEKAYENTANDVYLIIEEMSRGDCSAIFGDIFQLLDREKNGANRGYSKYFINNELIAKDIIALSTSSKVKLPSNFHILGTVNTSDQNVYVMDTAFKRRFEWEYVSPDPVLDSAPGVNPIIYKNDVPLSINDGTGMRSIQWVDLYQKLNKFIADDKYLGLGEDKQLGPFFIDFDITASATIHKNQIKNKLLHYLWSDVHKASFKSDIRLFKDDLGTFAELYKAFEADQQIFSSDFIAKL